MNRYSRPAAFAGEEEDARHDPGPRGTTMIQHLTKAVDHMSVNQVLAAGGLGTGTAGAAAAIDPAYVASWLQVGATGAAVLTGLATFYLVFLKIRQQRRVNAALKAAQDRRARRRRP